LDQSEEFPESHITNPVCRYLSCPLWLDMVADQTRWRLMIPQLEALSHQKTFHEKNDFQEKKKHFHEKNDFQKNKGNFGYAVQRVQHLGIIGGSNHPHTSSKKWNKFLHATHGNTSRFSQDIVFYLKKYEDAWNDDSRHCGGILERIEHICREKRRELEQDLEGEDWEGSLFDGQEGWILSELDNSWYYHWWSGEDWSCEDEHGFRWYHDESPEHATHFTPWADEDYDEEESEDKDDDEQESENEDNAYQYQSGEEECDYCDQQQLDNSSSTSSSSTTIG